MCRVPRQHVKMVHVGAVLQFGSSSPVIYNTIWVVFQNIHQLFLFLVFLESWRVFGLLYFVVVSVDLKIVWCIPSVDPRVTSFLLLVGS